MLSDLPKVLTQIWSQSARSVSRKLASERKHLIKNRCCPQRNLEIQPCPNLWHNQVRHYRESVDLVQNERFLYPNLSFLFRPLTSVWLSQCPFLAREQQACFEGVRCCTSRFIHQVSHSRPLFSNYKVSHGSVVVLVPQSTTVPSFIPLNLTLNNLHIILAEKIPHNVNLDPVHRPRCRPLPRPSAEVDWR